MPYFKNLSVFRRFFISYLLLILLFFVTNLFTYSRLIQILEKSTKDHYYSVLLQSQQIINQYLTEIDNISKQILMNEQVSSFLTEDIYDKESDSYDPYITLEAKNFLKTYMDTNLLMDNIYLYSQRSNAMISYNTIFRVDKLYGDTFQLGNFSYNEVKNDILQAFQYKKIFPEMMVNHLGNVQKQILYCSSVPVGEKKNITGAIMILINSDRLQTLFHEASASDASFYFYNGSGELVTMTENAPLLPELPDAESSQLQIDGNTYLVYTTTSSDGRKYAASIPYSVITNELSEMKLITYASFILSLILCWLLALYLSKRNTQPIRNLASRLNSYSDEPSKTDEISVISGAMSKLIASDEQFREEMKRNLPILRSNFLHTLILGGSLFSNEEIQERIQHLNISLTGKYYVIVLLSIVRGEGSNIEELSAANTLIKNIYCSNLSAIFTDIGENDIVFLTAFEQEDTNQNYMLIEDELNRMIDDLYINLNVMLKCAVGDTFTNLEEAGHSYQSARDAMDYGTQTVSNNIVWYVSSSALNAGYYYPIEMESRLINALKTSNLGQVNEILSAIEHENSENRILTNVTISYLYFDIKSTIYKVLGKLNPSTRQREEIEQYLVRIDSDVTLPKAFTLFKKVFSMLEEVHSLAPAGDLTTAMLEYIERHYSDPSLSRQSFAEYFNISEEYVSKYFKEHTNYKFLDYVEKVRIEAACKLLDERQYSIEKISAAVGYNSSVSFRRAFKRYMGITPSEYMK